MPRHYLILVIVMVVILLLMGAANMIGQMFNLNSIKSKTVGDGQHGTSRWATVGHYVRDKTNVPVRQVHSGQVA